MAASNLGFVHVVNPVVKPSGHELMRAQAVAFASMLEARRWATGKVLVEHVAACFPEDRPLVPAWFERTSVLSRSIRDEVPGEPVPKLPVLADVITSAAEGSSAEYLVYTNADITLMPFFYEAAAELLQQGWDSLIINRRTIPDRFERSLSLLCSEVGAPHPGFDCFVFPRSWFPDMVLGDAVLGASGTDWLLAVNVWALSRKNLTATDLHLTFHLGDEKSWHRSRDSDWWRASSMRTSKAITGLMEKHGPHQWFEWPRPTRPKRTLLQRGMNRLARELLARFPDQT